MDRQRWLVVGPIATATLCSLAVAILVYDRVPLWCKIEILPDWYITQRRIQKAALEPVKDGLPRGYVKRRSLLGRVTYHDLVTDQEFENPPGKRPLYEPLAGFGDPPNLQQLELRLLVVVPTSHTSAPIECMLLKVPFLYHAVLAGRSPNKNTYWLRQWQWWTSRLPMLKNMEKRPPDVWQSAFGNILSYCWGDPGITEEIMVNDQPYAITTNLIAALRQLRENAGQTPIFLWVDSICINQNDPDEVGRQFTLMSYYYGLAHTVHCWLGVMDDIKSRDRFFDVHFQETKSLGEYDSAVVSEKFLSGTYTADEIKDDIICLRAMTNLPYWSRKWIIQEVVLAKRLQVHIGSRNIRLRRPINLVKTLSHLERGLYTKSLIVSSREGYEEHRKVFEEYAIANTESVAAGLMAGFRLRELSDGQSADLTTLHKEIPIIVEQLRMSLATQPKDAVLGLMALIEEPFTLKVTSDMDCNNIYWTTTVQIMKVTQSLGLLYQARFGDNGDGYPSYMVDFSPPNESVRFIKGNGWVRQTSAGSRPNFKFLSNGFLQTTSFQLGVITAIWKAQTNPLVKAAQRGLSHSHLWTRTRHADWMRWLDKHDPDPDHLFQLDFLHQGLTIECVDCGTGHDPTEEELAAFRVKFAMYLSGDDSAIEIDVKHCLDNLSFFVTDRGQFGMLHPKANIKVGHAVVTLPSTPVPFVVEIDQPGFTCSKCQINAEESFHACDICYDGALIVCKGCYADGSRCSDPSHDLAAYELVGKKARRLSPPATSEGDRLDLEGTYYTLLGGCYLHGVMNGEAVRAAALERFGDETRVDDVFEKVFIY